MQEGDSLEGDRLVYWFKKGRGRVPAFSAKLALAGFSGTSAPRELPEIPLSPAVVASAIRGASKRGKRCKSSEGAATASSGTAGKPFTAQQHAVVAALMVVMKRAMREGHEAVLTAMTRLLCNNLYTVVVLELMGEDQELPSMKAIEQALLGEGQDLVDLLARQCAAADFQPLEVFTRSAQCGAMTACKLAHSIAVANSPQRAAALTRHYLVAELEEHFEKHSLPPTWGNTTSNLLMRQGIPRGMAELVIYLVPLLEGLCKRCFYPADPWQGGAREYAAMDHLLPGSCHFCTVMYRLAKMAARITLAEMPHSVAATHTVHHEHSYCSESHASHRFVISNVPCAGFSSVQRCCCYCYNYSQCNAHCRHSERHATYSQEGSHVRQRPCPASGPHRESAAVVQDTRCGMWPDLWACHQT